MIKRGTDGEIKHLTPDAANSMSRGDLDSEDVRWAARRRMALWSFRFMVVAATFILGYGLLAPSGAATVNAMMGVITFLFGTFGSVILGYFGIDAVARSKNQKESK